MSTRFAVLATSLLLAAALGSLLLAQKTADSDPWSPAQVLGPGELAAHLANKQPPQMQILSIGFNAMYTARHIPGAIYAGPASTDEGIENLKQAVANVPKNRQIVLYCGCCPWNKCPNIRPAFRVLHGLGFTNVKVLEISNSFAKDWTEKGFPADPPASSDAR